MKKISVMDDDPNAVQLLKLALEAQGYQVFTASASCQGLRQIWAEQPDLLILDVTMPDLDGFEVCRQLRQAPQTEELPIIMLSARREVTGVCALQASPGAEPGQPSGGFRPAGDRPDAGVSHLLQPPLQTTDSESCPQPGRIPGAGQEWAPL